MYFQQRGLWFLHHGTPLQIIQYKMKRSCIAIPHEKNGSKFHTVYDKLTLGLGQHPYPPELIWQHVWPSEHSDFWSGQITLSALHRNRCTKCTLLCSQRKHSFDSKRIVYPFKSIISVTPNKTSYHRLHSFFKSYNKLNSNRVLIVQHSGHLLHNHHHQLQQH